MFFDHKNNKGKILKILRGQLFMGHPLDDKLQVKNENHFWTEEIPDFTQN